MLKKPLTVNFQKQINTCLQVDNGQYFTLLSQVFTDLEQKYLEDIKHFKDDTCKTSESLKNLSQCYKCIMLVADM